MIEYLHPNPSESHVSNWQLKGKNALKLEVKPTAQHHQLEIVAPICCNCLLVSGVCHYPLDTHTSPQPIITAGIASHRSLPVCRVEKKVSCPFCIFPLLLYRSLEVIISYENPFSFPVFDWNFSATNRTNAVGANVLVCFGTGFQSSS